MTHSSQYDISSAQPTHSDRIRYKQVARIIKHLCKDLAKQRPDVAMPTGWMVDNLLFNCPSDVFHQPHWQSMVIELLNHLVHMTSCQQADSIHWQRHDSDNPLFPNHDFYDEQDAHRFCCALLDYLHAEIPLQTPQAQHK